MSGWFTDDNGELHRFAGGSGFKSALPVGAIFASAIPLTDSSVHALDGSTISQTGMYEQFASLIKSLESAGFKITCTQEEFDTSVSTYGQCGKFVINNTSRTIRLPLITEFIASNNGGQEIGIAQLDMFKAHTHGLPTRNIYASGGAYGGTYVGNPMEESSGETGGSETRPKNIRYPYYIVLANGFEDVVSGGSGGGSDYDDTEIREQIQELQADKADKTELYNGSVSYYGTSDTTSDNETKIVDCPSFKLVNGARISVHFSYENTTNSTKLNINNTGAIDVIYSRANSASSLVPNNWWGKGTIVDFVYKDGWYYVLTNKASVNNYGYTRLTHSLNDVNRDYALSQKAGQEIDNRLKALENSGGSKVIWEVWE